MIYVEPDKCWHCFLGNFGETAEGQGRVHMGLPMCNDAILSRNWEPWLMKVDEI